ncbi:MAG: YhcH/YjgK/YiaL family protein [Chloroflexi bacterium]|nr:YhcH/YjgK/YiaL family protein [Chloroflexota bacterium]
MILDQLKNAAQYYGLGAGLAAGLKYLQETDLKSIAPGRYEIDGDRLFVLIMDYNTKAREQAFWEAHRNYYDIQYVLKGVERMGFASLANLQAGAYDESKDFVPAEGPGDNILVPAGSFAIFAPQDAHIPSLNAGAESTAVRKIVVKVKL